MEGLNKRSPIDLTKKIIIDKDQVNDCIHEGDVMSDKRHINLRISEGTENQISNVRRHLKLPDDQTTVKMAIALYSKLVDDKKAGREVRIHYKNGNQYRLKFATGS